jgi:beta-lactamase regulating signal transducer with metallopeptidase domain
MTAAALASWLFAATWKGSLLVAFALAVHRVARNRIPSRWLCALLLLAVLRLLAPVAPASTFSVFNLVPAAAPAPPSEAMITETRMRSPNPPPLVLPSEVPPTTPRSWIPLVLAIWILGVAFVIARAVVQTTRFRRRLRDAQRVDLGTLLDDCREALHIRRRVPVFVTRAVAAPSLHGWLRPALLLPEGFLDTFTRQQLRYAVLHELAHLRRSDVLVNWIATAAAALHWFNPLVRLALSRLAEERELACDALALEAVGAEERHAYGGTVLEIVDRLRQTQLVPALVGMTANPRQLKRRILMIASFKKSRYSVVFAAMVVAVGLVTLTDAQAHEPGVMRMRQKVQLSPEANAVLQTLEKSISPDLRSASVSDVMDAVTTATGVKVTAADGAVDPALRLNVKGENVPAHIVLMESAHAAGLQVKITEAGVELTKADRDDDGVPGEREEERVIIKRQPAGGEQRKRMVEAEATNDGTTDKRKITIRGENGETTGTLEVEVVK